jgi:hypothetical protein
MARLRVPLTDEFGRAKPEPWVDTGNVSERSVCGTGYGWLTTLMALKQIAQRPSATIEHIDRSLDRLRLPPSERNPGPESIDCGSPTVEGSRLLLIGAPGTVSRQCMRQTSAQASAQRRPPNVREICYGDLHPGLLRQGVRDSRPERSRDLSELAHFRRQRSLVSIEIVTEHIGTLVGIGGSTGQFTRTRPRGLAP